VHLAYVVDELGGTASSGEKHSLARGVDITAFVVASNAVLAGLGGLYAATRSVVVTAVGGVLVVMIGLVPALLRRR
jgi:hypothetical protein